MQSKNAINVVLEKHVKKLRALVRKCEQERLYYGNGYLDLEQSEIPPHIDDWRRRSFVKEADLITQVRIETLERFGVKSDADPNTEAVDVATN